jgi:hypothetical protein
MISRYFSEGPWKGLTSLDLALTPDEIEILKYVAATATDWEKGRQGSGYFKLDLKELSVDFYNLSTVRTRLLNAIQKHTHATGPEIQKANDFWLIYYPEGVGVCPHKDPAPAKAKHVRANVAVTKPLTGGVFRVPNGYFKECDLPIDLLPGQGVVFSPSEVQHSVTDAGIGGRLVVSVGAIISA